jgi:hypothetical protein
MRDTSATGSGTFGAFLHSVDRGLTNVECCADAGVTADTTNGNKKYFVLSLDGGGSRCIIQTVILQRLVQVFPDLLRYRHCAHFNRERTRTTSNCC